ncbi:MAG: glycoside hydrolase family 97 protein [Reichenbachiella sp.]
MLRLGGLIAVLSLMVVFTSCKDNYTVESPNGKISVLLMMESGVPYYQVNKNGQPIISASRLGLLLKGQIDLAKDFEVENVDYQRVSKTWSQPWGEVKNVKENYNELKITLSQDQEGVERVMNIVFKVFDDGIGFRYEFPQQENLTEFVIINELTEFNIVHDMDVWWIPAYSEATDYEVLYSKSKISELDQNLHTPVTMEMNDSLFISIHEASLVDYAAMTLMPNDVGGFDCDLVPWSTGEKVITKAPTQSPWRTIIIGDNAGELLTSNLILNLNEPSKIDDTSWITTGKYAGIWWGMHVNTQTWGQGPIHGASTSNVKELIDFAAESGLKAVLVEGWNIGWDNDWTIGDFDFDQPYEDFDIEELSRYSKEKGVSIIGHHETGGNIANYESQIIDAFEFLKRYDIPAVKTGYVTDKINNKEYHQSQFSVNHYNYVTELAMEYRVMLDMHEPVKATGLRRTYPHLMTREGARGTEYEAWSEGNPPEHTLILPFTRCLGGPLDYTPGIFDINIKTRPDNRIHTTLAKQLALYVTIYSPWQMAADLPENYKGQPAFQFIKDVPTNWEDTKILNAKIGNYLTMVRKDRLSDDWYLGSVTDEESRSFDVSLDFLLPGKNYRAYVYADGKSADLLTNPVDVDIHELIVSADQNLNIKLATGGGQAIRFQLLD